jgi:hypothetical protein
MTPEQLRAEAEREAWRLDNMPHDKYPGPTRAKAIMDTIVRVAEKYAEARLDRIARADESDFARIAAERDTLRVENARLTVEAQSAKSLYDDLKKSVDKLVVHDRGPPRDGEYPGTCAQLEICLEEHKRKHDKAQAENTRLAAEVEAAWQAVPHRGAIRGMVPLSDVLRDLYEGRDQLRAQLAEAKKEAERYRTERDAQLGASGEATVLRKQIRDVNAECDKAETQASSPWAHMRVRSIIAERDAKIERLRAGIVDECSKSGIAQLDLIELQNKAREVAAELDREVSTPGFGSMRRGVISSCITRLLVATNGETEPEQALDKRTVNEKVQSIRDALGFDPERWENVKCINVELGRHEPGDPQCPECTPPAPETKAEPYICGCIEGDVPHGDCDYKREQRAKGKPAPVTKTEPAQTSCAYPNCDCQGDMPVCDDAPAQVAPRSPAPVAQEKCNATLHKGAIKCERDVHRAAESIRDWGSLHSGGGYWWCDEADTAKPHTPKVISLVDDDVCGTCGDPLPDCPTCRPEASGDFDVCFDEWWAAKAALYKSPKKAASFRDYYRLVAEHFFRAGAAAVQSIGGHRGA